MKTCGEVLVEILENYGIDTVFGIPGVHTVELYRGIYATGDFAVGRIKIAIACYHNILSSRKRFSNRSKGFSTHDDWLAHCGGFEKC